MNDRWLRVAAVCLSLCGSVANSQTTPAPVNPLRQTGLYIVAGQGQVLPNNFGTDRPGYEPLTVRLTDANGAPIAGATIRWSVSGQGGGISSGVQETVTDANGQASVNFFATTVFQVFQPYQESVVTATAPSGQSVQFRMNVVPADQSTFGGASPIRVEFGNTTRAITIRAGETLPEAIKAVVSSTNLTNAVPLPNVGMRIINSNTDPNTQPMVACRNYYVLSNAQGQLTCDLVAGPVAGEATVTVAVGAWRETFNVRVEQGLPGTIVILQGNNQTVGMGQLLGQNLAIEVRDAAGNPLPNVPVTWTAPLGTFVNQQSTTDAGGRALASFRAPSDRSGVVTITVQAGNNASTTFTVNVLSSGTGTTGTIVAQSGANQVASVGQAFGQALSVRVTDAQGQPAVNQMVDFRVTTGSATVNPTSAQTNAQGVATTNVTAGTTTGPVVITASTAGLATTFNLTIQAAPAGPQFTAADILNAAGFQPGVSPGSIAYIRVRGIAPNLRGSVQPNIVVGPLPTRLSDVDVTFNGTPAPIFAVSNVNGEESVVVQVPFEVTPGNATVTIRTASAGSATVQNVPISPVKPGVFTTVDANGMTFAVATRPDGTYVSSTNPARRGEEIRIYVTGVGQTSSATATNHVGLAGQMVAAQVIAGLNNAGVRVRSAQLVEGSVGVYVVTMEVPLDTALGPNQPLGFAVVGPDGQVVFANGTAIPIV